MYTLMLVDDEAIERAGIKLLVQKHFPQITHIQEAQNGYKAIDLYHNVTPDIIIMDITMPGIDGLRTIEEIQKQGGDPQIIILTAHNQFKYAQTAIRLGVKDFLLKPTNITHFKKIMQKVIQALDKQRRDSIQFLPENNGGDHTHTTQATAAYDYIKEHYNTNIALEDLAKHLHISTYYICKVLKKEFGKSFIELINEHRINKAKKLLMDPRCSVKEAAFYVGYNSQHYFAKIFKKYLGVTPTEYRKQ